MEAGAGSLPDARILSDGSGRLLLLTGATNRCGHGVLGDSIEAGAATLVESRPEPSVVFTISIPDPAVVEGIAPIWADLTGDGRREVIVTVSDASGPPIGRSLRWRHEIAVAPFGPGGETEIAAVTLPDGSMAVGVGRDDGTLRVWLPIPSPAHLSARVAISRPGARRPARRPPECGRPWPSAGRPWWSREASRAGRPERRA